MRISFRPLILALLIGLTLVALVGEGPAAAAGGNGTQVDLELVLAVDASGSVDDTEFGLQLSGIAEAFRDPAVQQAIASGPTGLVAVALVIWADSTQPKDQSAWHILAGASDAEAFADLVETFPRRVQGGTGIGSAIAHSAHMIERNNIDGFRRTIDVSGDGRETTVREELAIMLPAARGMVIELGITVNGLAILNDDAALDAWYRTFVIAGPGHFVMKAHDYADFRLAIREKLLREIAPRFAEAEANRLLQ